MGGTAPIDLAIINSKTSFTAVTSQSPPPPSRPPPSTANFPVLTGNCDRKLSRSCFPSEKHPGSVIGKQDKRVNNDIFRLVPSKFEVETAIAALHGLLQRISSSGSQSNWLIQVLDKTVVDFFRLLQTEPVIKTLVISLATDKNVWEAIMKNQKMQQLKESFVLPVFEFAVENCSTQNYDKEQDLVSYMVNLFMDFTKEKINQLIEKFQSLMNQIFPPVEMGKAKNGEENGDYGVEETVQSSLLLTIVILLIVVVARLSGA